MKRTEKYADIAEKCGSDRLDQILEQLSQLSNELKRMSESLYQIAKYDRDVHNAIERVFPEISSVEKGILVQNSILYDSKWLVRDPDGRLMLFNGKPQKKGGSWVYLSEDPTSISKMKILPFQSMFKFVKWEDEEPWSISELLEE